MLRYFEKPVEIELPETITPGSGHSFVFEIPNPPNGDEKDQAFIFRLEDSSLVGYINRCGHISLPLDYDDGLFFDTNGFLICRVHGARYDAATGEIVLGPARTPLIRLILEEEKDGNPANLARVRILGYRRDG